MTEHDKEGVSPSLSTFSLPTQHLHLSFRAMGGVRAHHHTRNKRRWDFCAQHDPPPLVSNDGRCLRPLRPPHPSTRAKEDERMSVLSYFYYYFLTQMTECDLPLPL